MLDGVWAMYFSMYPLIRAKQDAAAERRTASAPRKTPGETDDPATSAEIYPSFDQAVNLLRAFFVQWH